MARSIHRRLTAKPTARCENAVKLVKCRMRTLKLCLERRIGKRIPPRHPIMSCLAPHAAAILRYGSRGDDGKQPYEIIRLRPFNSRLIAFGERCSYKIRAKETADQEHIWHQGIFLGICPSTGQYILHCVERNVIKIPERSSVFQIRPGGTQRILKQCEFHHLI